MQIATIGPNLRMVVFQFLLREQDVPPAVQLKRPSDTTPLTPIPGKEVLPSTPRLNLLNLLLNLLDTLRLDTERNPYELVDAWFEYTERADDKRKVRFVLCHKDHVRHDELHPEFVTRQDQLLASLADLLYSNVWAVQGYLNPYMQADGHPTGHKVLMFNCAGRVPTTDPDGTQKMMWSGGRDEMKRGVGELVAVRDLSKKINLDGENIVLENASLATLAKMA